MQPSHAEALARFDLNGENREYLTKVGKLVIPMLDDTLDHFYSLVMGDSAMSAFFKSASMQERAKAAQKRHWELLLSGEFPADYFASAERVGRIHPKIGLPFIFYLSGYAHANAHIMEKLLKGSGGLFRNRDMPRMATALARAFALDTHLILDAHFAAEKEEQDLAFKYLKEGIDRLAARDLTKPIPSPAESDYPEAYDPVRVSFNALIDEQSQVMETIQNTAAGLRSIADTVSQSSLELSERTENQAATLEETAAALEEISASVKQATEATNETNKTVEKTRGDAIRSEEIVRDAIAKMEEIEQSSRKISQILNVIEDIAFQTNLLALNAGVEAARAGESGRGFAVVASEVRALAQRTTDSANEIKSLIDISSEQVESGVALVNQTGTALTQISEDISKTAGLTADVANSAAEQSTGLTEINIGVSQLDQVTQQNAAMVEETTAAVVSMKQDIEAMNELIRTFKINEAFHGSQKGRGADPAMMFQRTGS